MSTTLIPLDEQTDPDQEPAIDPSANGKPRRRATAEAMASKQRDISVSEFFAKNRHLLGFDNPRKALLTAVNDNALITYLATLVPGLSDELKYAVVAGAVAGGGLTVIANAPNPAGQALLSRFFGGSVLPVGLLLGALVPTMIASLAFLLL